MIDRSVLFESLLEEFSADWVLITDSIEVRYVTGLKSSNMHLLVGKAEKHIFTDFRYREMAEQYADNAGWEFHELCADCPKVNSFLASGNKVLVQSNLISVDNFKQLETSTEGVTFLFEGTRISSLFSTKDESQIRSIRKAASIADEALKKWKDTLYTGISERDAADLLEKFCKEGGSEGPSFDTIVLFGEHAAYPHGVPDSRKLEVNQTILVDFGCLVDGYCSDMTRTFFYGEPSLAERERYELTLRAQRAGVDAVCAGRSASEIDHIVRSIINDAGFGEQFGHGTGHGVGLRIHEAPALNSRDETVLEAGMIVTVEPGIYVPGESGVRIEDLLLVTADGAESLSQSPRELLSVKPVDRNF